MKKIILSLFVMSVSIGAIADVEFDQKQIQFVNHTSYPNEQLSFKYQLTCWKLANPGRNKIANPCGTKTFKLETNEEKSLITLPLIEVEDHPKSVYYEVQILVYPTMDEKSLNITSEIFTNKNFESLEVLATYQTPKLEFKPGTHAYYRLFFHDPNTNEFKAMNSEEVDKKTMEENLNLKSKFISVATDMGINPMCSVYLSWTPTKLNEEISAFPRLKLNDVPLFIKDFVEKNNLHPL